MLVDDLYKKYSDAEIPARLDWDKVKPRLKRKLFLYFTPRKFNVYYLLLMISFLGFASYTTYRNYFMRKEIPQTPVHYKTTIDTLKQVVEPVKSVTDKQNKDSNEKPVQRKKILINIPDSIGIKKDSLPAERMQFKCIKRTVAVKPDTLKRK